MSRLAPYILGALLTLSPALLLAQDSHGTDSNGQAATPQATAPHQSSLPNGGAERAPINPAPIGGDYGNTGSADRSMPDTSANWLGMLLSGGILGGAGLTLRRVRARG